MKKECGIYWMLIVLLITSYYSCTKKDDNLKDYYFPIENFSQLKRYCYIDKNLNDKKYWLMSSPEKEKLITEIYNKEYSLTEKTIEEYTKNSVDLKEYTVYNVDSSIWTGIVINDKVFNWTQLEDEVINWKVTFRTKQNESCTFSKSRKYMGKVIDFYFYDTAYPSIQFHDVFEIVFTTTTSSSINKITYEIESTYSKGLGLTKYCIKDGDKKYDYCLEKIE